MRNAGYLRAEICLPLFRNRHMKATEVVAHCMLHHWFEHSCNAKRGSAAATLYSCCCLQISRDGQSDEHPLVSVSLLHIAFPSVYPAAAQRRDDCAFQKDDDELHCVWMTDVQDNDCCKHEQVHEDRTGIHLAEWIRAKRPQEQGVLVGFKCCAM